MDIKDLYSEIIKSPTVKNIVLRRPFKKDIEGSICITSHHLIASSRDASEEVMILIKNIDAVEYKQTGAYCILTLRLKDFRVLTLQMPVSDDVKNVQYSLEQLKDIEDLVNYKLLYPFSYNSKAVGFTEDGWTAFMLDAEFAHLISSNDWRICHANADYSICPTYPSQFLVPAVIEDTVVRASAAFRQGGRLPVLAYCHKEKCSFLLRSSQPMLGINSGGSNTASGSAGGPRRCREDERLLNSVLSISKVGRGYIVDTRSAQALRQAHSRSAGGLEPDHAYPQWRKLSQPVERPAGLQDSFRQLLTACQASNSMSMDKWLSKLESCGWLGHVRSLLNAACMVAQCLDREASSVLVHGGEGRDTTLQVTALAQVILHSDCRTVRGFEALIDREWIQAGHPFRTRCKTSAFAKSSSGEAPIFLLFLDCVWQIWRQHPCAFEFSEDLLILLARHVYASEFGTFLCDSPKEMRDRNVAVGTVSLWSYLSAPSVLEEYMNPLYEPCHTQRHLYACWPSVAPQSLALWEELYLASVVDTGPRELVRKQMREIREEQLEAKQRVVKLRRILVGLQHDAVAEGVLPNTQMMDPLHAGNSVNSDNQSGVDKSPS